MTETFLHAGHDVVVLDRFFFGDTLADLRANPRLTLVKADTRDYPASVLKGVDAVCDLAALSNDPAGELDPRKTLDINHEARARTARLAKERGVKRYVLASSCSIYGFQDEAVDESSKINPLTTYAEANGLAEQSNLPLADGKFTVTALRQATVYGASRRMRFDLAVNGMTLALHKQGSVKVMRDGTQWRPFVHVRDTCRAFLAVLTAEPAKVNGQIFNVGSDDQNIQVLPLAKRVTEAVGLPFKEDWYGDPDHRSYRVSFAKIRNALGYRTERTFEDGAREIYAKLKSGELKGDDPRTNTLGWYKTLTQWNETIRDVALDGRIL
jgi:nucleoside-diphosphate-sugar epimerase